MLDGNRTDDVIKDGQLVPKFNPGGRQLIRHQEKCNEKLTRHLLSDKFYKTYLNHSFWPECVCMCLCVFSLPQKQINVKEKREGAG